MSDSFQPDLDFDAARSAVETGEALILDLDAYEGPLDVLLALARTQKVDLLQISVARLADQYLVFIREARRLRFSLAADYLVMAAWLAWLKSRLLLPRPERGKAGELGADEAAQQLAFRLAKLDAMRKAAEALLTGPVLGREVFGRGDPEEARIVSSSRIAGDLYELMDAYVSQRRREARRHYTPAPPQAWPLEDARERLRSMLPDLQRWTPLTGLAPLGSASEGPSRASFVASTLSATLEFVREGDLEARQLEAFTEIYLRRRPSPLRGGSPMRSIGGVGEFELPRSLVSDVTLLTSPPGLPRDEPGVDHPPHEGEGRVERMVEALLFAAAEPLAVSDLARRLPEGADVAAALAALAARYEGRGVRLCEVGGRWRFQTAEDLAFLMTEERSEPRRLSRAAQETLAIVAYHQPVTRAEIEAIRGVQASRGTLDVLLEIGFVRPRGRRRTPGRPVTYATTDVFLEHFGLASLADLPGAAEMKAAGLLSLDLPADFAVPDPSQTESDDEPFAEDAGAEFHTDFLGADAGEGA